MLINIIYWYLFFNLIGDSNSEVSIKNESIFEKSTQMLDSDAETDIEENLSGKHYLSFLLYSQYET